MRKRLHLIFYHFQYICQIDQEFDDRFESNFCIQTCPLAIFVHAGILQRIRIVLPGFLLDYS
jgi:hypothetical protein